VEPDFDTAVKLEIYRTIAVTARIPSASEVARALASGGADAGGDGDARGEAGASGSAADVQVEAVLAAFERLGAKRLLVAEPSDPSRIRMAPPFSGVPTPFRVQVREQTYFANCVWDALGVAAALHADAVVGASDGFTGEPMSLEVKGGSTVPAECVIHFAVPAARWWDDIVYT
jgi:hypothetical protein